MGIKSGELGTEIIQEADGAYPDDTLPAEVTYEIASPEVRPNLPDALMPLYVVLEDDEPAPPPQPPTEDVPTRSDAKEPAETIPEAVTAPATGDGGNFEPPNDKPETGGPGEEGADDEDETGDTPPLTDTSEPLATSPTQPELSSAATDLDEPASAGPAEPETPSNDTTETAPSDSSKETVKPKLPAAEIPLTEAEVTPVEHEAIDEPPTAETAPTPDSAEKPELAIEKVLLERMQIDRFSDASLLKVAATDFKASYETDEPATGEDMRQRTMAWTDWLAEKTELKPNYRELSTIAAEHGDAETVRQIVEDPKRLQAEHGTTYEKFGPNPEDQPSTGHLNLTAGHLAELINKAPAEHTEQVHDAVMPTLKHTAEKLAARDLTYEGILVGLAVDALHRADTPETKEQANVLMNALPMTAGKLDILEDLAERHPDNSEFTSQAAEIAAWHEEKTRLAKIHFAPFAGTYITRNVIDLPRRNYGSELDPDRGQQIAATIVDHLPEPTAPTSPLETSLAYATNSAISGSMHANLQAGVRVILNNPGFELADPQFGFAATAQEDNTYANERVNIVDPNLPNGLVIELSATRHIQDNALLDDARFLCRLVQAEKDRRLASQ